MLPAAWLDHLMVPIAFMRDGRPSGQESNGRPGKQVGYGIDKEGLNLKDRLHDLLNKERIM